MGISYKDSGVDVTEGYRAVELMKKHIKSTFNGNVLGDIGSFGGCFSLEGFSFKQPVLVAGTDGVGTKLKYAFTLEKFDTVGIDCVAMCVNDIVCQGAKPLFFLDYIACGKLFPETVAEIVSGVAEGCRQSEAALIGGETAEMPGFYPVGEYDLAGFAVGIAEKSKIIDGKSVKAGDVLIGIPSSGLHSNGFSLVRKIFDPEDLTLMNTYSDELSSKIGEALLTPTRIYVKTALSLINKVNVKGVAHITGGGFIENIPRILPSPDLGIAVDTGAYDIPPIFQMLTKKAGISKRDAYNTFNMGIGMVFAVNPEDADTLIREARALGEKPCVLGEVTSEEGVRL